MNVLTRYKNRSKDFENGYKHGFEEGVKAAVKINLFQVIQYLGDKRGWKRERIFEALLWLYKHAEMILEDYTTFDEVVEAVKEEYGIIYDNGSFILLDEKEWKETV